MDIPLETMDANDAGGVGAKKGFLYQDLAAAFYLSQMLFDKKLKTIRCEVTDDIDLVFDCYTEYVQVKTTDSEKLWSIDELSKISSKGKQDSILHKSLSCDKTPGLTCRFRILSPRGLNSYLTYLKIKITDRNDKPGREKIINSINKKLKKFVSTNNNNGEYWVDNFWWEIISSKEQLELQLLKNIRHAALERGCNLLPREEFNILCNMVYTLNKKSSVSRKLFTADDKSYTREDFITWFEEELNVSSSENTNRRKMYIQKFEGNDSILKEHDPEVYSNASKSFIGKFYYQGYSQLKYNFKHISNGIYNWLPEVVLSPEELDTINGLNFAKSFSNFAKEIDLGENELAALIPKVILHSIIRMSKSSQPIISAEIYSKTKTFDNVHIVINRDDPDELWIGFSNIIPNDNVFDSFNILNNDLFRNFIDDFTNQKKLILNIKKDPYLLKHDIDDILKSNANLDECFQRFNFVFFLGYKTQNQPLEYDADSSNEYFANLLEEVKSHSSIIGNNIAKDAFLNKLNISICVYPIPCVDTLIGNVKNKLMGIK